MSPIFIWYSAKKLIELVLFFLVWKHAAIVGTGSGWRTFFAKRVSLKSNILSWWRQRNMIAIRFWLVLYRHRTHHKFNSDPVSILFYFFIRVLYQVSCTNTHNYRRWHVIWHVVCAFIRIFCTSSHLVSHHLRYYLQADCGHLTKDRNRVLFLLFVVMRPTACCPCACLRGWRQTDSYKCYTLFPHLLWWLDFSSHFCFTISCILLSGQTTPTQLTPT